MLPAPGAAEQGATDGFSILTDRDSRVRGGNHRGGLHLAGGDGVVTRAELQRPRCRRATAAASGATEVHDAGREAECTLGRSHDRPARLVAVGGAAKLA